MFEDIKDKLRSIREFLLDNKKIALCISAGVLVSVVIFTLFINYENKVKTEHKGNKNIIEAPVKMSNELVIMSPDLAKDLGMAPQNNQQNNVEEVNNPKATGVLSLEEIDNILKARLKDTQDAKEETVENVNNNSSSEGYTTESSGDYYNKQDEYIKQLLTSEDGAISRYMNIKLIEIRNFLTVNILNSGFHSIKSYAETGKSKYGDPVDINILMARMGTVMERKRGYDELFSLVDGRELKEIASVWYKVSQQIDAKYSEVVNNQPVAGQPYNLDLSSLETSIQEFYAVLDNYGISL